jgi:hypothetical protein
MVLLRLDEDQYRSGRITAARRRAKVADEPKERE